MGYSVYRVGKRWGGYGVPAICESPKCKIKIDRGMAYACGEEPFSEHGCDRYFCGKHLYFTTNPDITVLLCAMCRLGNKPYPYKPEVKRWVKHLLTDESWEEWRKKNPKEVKALTNLNN